MGSPKKNGSSGGGGRPTIGASVSDSPETRYSLDAEIGSGANSRVYRAWDGRLSRFVALKLLDTGLTGEWETLVSLSSQPFIVELYDRGVIVDKSGVKRPFIAMPLLEGYSLDKKPSILRDLRVVKQVIQGCCRALTAAHERSITHCDLKPSNIFIKTLQAGHYGTVTVLDFGLATRLLAEPVTANGGTQAYMSPEQILGKPVNEATDIFSLGVVAYEVLTGEHPFTRNVKAATRDELRMAITSAIPAPIVELNPAVPKPVALVIHRALAKDPQERPSAKQIDEWLEQDRVFVAEAKQVQHALTDIERIFEGGDFEAASSALRRLELRGFAFDPLTALRSRIDASRADQDVELLNADAREHLEFLRLEEANKLLDKLKIIPSRRFDIRVLDLESELEFRQREALEAASLLQEAQQATRAGSPRRADWFQGRLDNLRGCSPFEVAGGGHSGAADTFASEVNAIPAHRAEGNRDDTGRKRPEDATIVQSTDTFEGRVKQRRALLEKAVELVTATDFQEQLRLTVELEEMCKADPGDAIADVLNLFLTRKAKIDALSQLLAQSEIINDLGGALQALESLQAMVHSPELESRRAQLEGRLALALVEDWSKVAVRNLTFLAQTGRWELARKLLDRSISSFRVCDEYWHFHELTEERLASQSERNSCLENYLCHLRQGDLDQAGNQLELATHLDPDNKIIAIGAAYLDLARAKRSDRLNDSDGAFDLREHATRLLGRHGDSPVLAAAVDELNEVAVPIAKLGLKSTPTSDVLPLAESGQFTPVHQTGGPTLVTPALPRTWANHPQKWAFVCVALLALGLLATATILVIQRTRSQISPSTAPTPSGRALPAPVVKSEPNVIKREPNEFELTRSELERIEQQFGEIREGNSVDEQNQRLETARAGLSEFRENHPLGKLPPGLALRLTSLEKAAATLQLRSKASLNTSPGDAVRTKGADKLENRGSPPGADLARVTPDDDVLKKVRLDRDHGRYAQALQEISRLANTPERAQLLREVTEQLKVELDSQTLREEQAIALRQLDRRVGRLLDQDTRQRLQPQVTR